MSLALLFPLGLLALTALLLPLLIHLARRQQHAPLDFAALRWLQARMRPRSKVRVDEWPLLLVRLLLLAALALLLARPVLQGSRGTMAAVTVVAPGLDGAALRGKDTEGDWRWLAPGFPALQQRPAATAQPLASLLRELDQALPTGTPLVVFVPDPLPGLDGERIRLSRNVQWRPVSMPVGPPAGALRAPRLHLGGSGDPAARHVLDAVQRAWTNQAPTDAGTGGTAPDDGQIGVWLANTPLPPSWQSWLAGGGTVLRVTAPIKDDAAWVAALRDAQGATVLEQRAEGRGRLLRFSAALSAAALPIVTEDTFPRRLLQVLQPLPAPALADATDQAPLGGAAPAAVEPRELAPWLLLVIVLLFALERWLATSARRRTQP